MSLAKIKVGVALGGEIHIYRHGKDPRVGLERRVATQEVMVAAATHLLHGMPKGSGAAADIWIDGKLHEISIKPTRRKKASVNTHLL